MSVWTRPLILGGWRRMICLIRQIGMATVIYFLDCTYEGEHDERHKIEAEKRHKNKLQKFSPVHNRIVFAAMGIVNA